MANGHTNKDVATVVDGHATTSVGQVQQQSRLLALAAEIRNWIYELAFTSNDDSTYTFNLFNAAPPSKHLLLACRQIYTEAKSLYQEAYRVYWSSTQFRIDGNEGEARMRCFTDEDLAHVRYLELHTCLSYLIHYSAVNSSVYDLPCELEMDGLIRSQLEDPELVLQRYADGNWWFTTVNGEPLSDEKSYRLCPVVDNSIDDDELVYDTRSWKDDA